MDELRNLLPKLKIPEIGDCITTEPLPTKADVLNARPGNLGELDCPVCKNRGCIYEMRGELLASVECGCMPRRRALGRIRRSGLADTLDRCTFESYQAAEPWQRRAKERAQAYAATPRGWFVITGTVGSGKTHLCTAIVGELIGRGFDVRYMPWRQEAPRLKSLVNEPEYVEALGAYQSASVLYIDDLWKGSVTEGDKNLAFALLDNRYADHRKITLISSERTIEDMLGIDEAIGSRIYERANVKLRIDGGNWRLALHG